MRGIIAPLVFLVLAAGAQAQNGNQPNIPPVNEWSYDWLYQQGGIRAENLLGADVLGQNGDAIGEVEDAVFNAQNQMVGIIAEVGGIWGIAATQVAVPFDQLDFANEGVRTPLTEANVDQFDLFRHESFVERGPGGQSQGDGAQSGQPRNWRLSQLMGDYAAFEPGAGPRYREGTGYGYVEDILISRDGQIQAVVVRAGVISPRGGQFAFPFDAYASGWQPGHTDFVLPYSREELSRLELFQSDEYDAMLD